MKKTALLIVLFVLVLLPWLALLILGGIWLWQQHYLLIAAPILLSSYGIAWILSQKLQQDEPLPPTLPSIDPDDRWSPAAKEIWDKIDALAKELNPADYPLTDAARLAALAKRVVTEVATHFKPEAGRAELDVPLRNILFIVEQVCRDMRELLDEKVPFSHLITVQDGLQVWQWKEKFKQFNYLRRTLAMAASPFTAIPNELSHFFTGKLTDYPKGLLERWLLQALVKKIGYYAIALYSGHFPPSAISTIETEQEENALAKRPLRVLIAGQAKAGKSSLINGLLGEFRTTVDVLPVADQLRLYKLQQPDMGDVLLYDSPGYSENDFWFQKNDRQLGDFDLVIVVCSAMQAGREADVRFLSELRNWFGVHLERRMPPVLVVVSHIDRLRPFREWDPPYDIENPDNGKARNIREAVETVAHSLQVAREDCVPVCLSTPAACYNIEAVLACMVNKLPDSMRTQYLRTLSEGQRKEKIMLLLGQLGIRRGQA
ncbi:GTPase [Methylomicrobium sp. Wu6]|uniref:GTPase family protein n=1 Tax=Methylomicrobium sp. Wu6 TaxID=3107928 RepID=UPI002DD6242A|nr:GTPase [Methylomicrobium sp. Wu6]MEC4747438.1 GTPase [Methylomicrobium sp. Wu6]